jgi:carbonic anhydrase
MLSSTLAFAKAVDDIPVTVKWNYRDGLGPQHWGTLHPEFAVCGAGKIQAPINIVEPIASGDNQLTIRYQTAPMVIMDDGNTNLLIGTQQTLVNLGHGLQLNFPETTSKELITYNGETYRLVQFHFHSPAETKLAGHQFPLEIHFVHSDEKGAGKLLVISVLIRSGKENATLQHIIEHIPLRGETAQVIEGERVNPNELLPANRAYYSFMGSLTTPPCSEGVQWLVMANTIMASPSQIVAFRQAAGGANARPVQALEGRKVEFNK